MAGGEATKPQGKETNPAAAAAAAVANESDDADDSVSSEEAGEDLILEGVLVRNAEASSSSSEDDADDSDEAEGKDKEGRAQIEANDKESNHRNKDDKKRPVPSGSQTENQRKKQNTGKKSEQGVVTVDFTFHDMDEKFFHGIKNLLHACSTVYQPHSSALTDLMIDNIAVGTVCSTEGDEEGNVYGFASVLNVTTYQDKPCIQYLKDLCLKNCPADRKKEMETVLSGKTARPAGFMFHGRMVNLPLEIVEVLQNQLVLDMDWAVENAEGGEAERKSLDFGAFVRLAPAHMDGGSLVYRFFDDETLSTNAEFVYNINAPPSYGSEEKHMVSIIVMTKTGHRQAIKELKQLVGSGGA